MTDGCLEHLAANSPLRSLTCKACPGVTNEGNSFALESSALILVQGSYCLAHKPYLSFHIRNVVNVFFADGFSSLALYTNYEG